MFFLEEKQKKSSVQNVCKMIEEWWKCFKKYLDISQELRPESLALLGSHYILGSHKIKTNFEFLGF